MSQFDHTRILPQSVARGNDNEIRRRLAVARAVADVGKKWEYFGRIADTRGFADRAAGTMEELTRAGYAVASEKRTGRLADVDRLFTAYRKYCPKSLDDEQRVCDAGEDRPDPTSASPRVELLEAPGPVGEARLVARRIRRRMEEGVSPADIVVTARDLDATADVFAEVFDEYGVPAHGFPAPPLARAPVVAFLLQAWRVPANGYAFAHVAAVLRSTFYRPPGVDAELPSKAEALLRKIGGPDGKDSFLRAVDRWAVAPMEPLEDEGPDSGTRRRTESLARACRPFLQAFFALWDDVPPKAKPREWIDRFLRFARDCGVEPATHPDDTTALESLRDGLNVWVDSTPATKAVPAAAFGTVLSLVASTARAPIPEPASPFVRILPADAARASACDTLFLTGLGEGSFPRLAPPDSLLTEQDRLALRADGHRLPDPGNRRAAVQQLFDDLLARPRTRLVLSYPAVDAKGQEQLPSSFLADWREKHTPDAVTRQTMLIQDYPSAEAYAAAEQRVRYADGLVKGSDGPPPPEAASLKRAHLVARARFNESEFNRFDGVLRPEFLDANRSLLGRHTVFEPDHVFSPTALEHAGDCPFRFWLDHVLGVEPLDDPPDEVEQTRRGMAIHRAMKRVHESGTKPDDPAQVAQTVRTEFDAAVTEYQARSGGPVSVALWELEARRLRRTANRYPEQWRTFREKEGKGGIGPAPQLFEASFGLPGDKDRPSRPPLVVTYGNVEVRVGGTVDRIDAAETAEGIGFWIIDYKSGRAGYYTGSAVERFESLQLPLYALAAERVLFPGQIARPLGLAFWLITDTGSKSVLSKKIAWDLFRDQLEEWVANLVSNIRQGAFPLAPRSKTCTDRCPHGPVCRITQHRNSGKRAGGELTVS